MDIIPYSGENMPDLIAYQRLIDADWRGSEKFALVEGMKESITSRSMHYANTFFEGAVVVVHQQERGGQRLYILHADWHYARLMNGLDYSLKPHVEMSQNQYMLAIVNLLYMNGWDVNAPVNFQGEIAKEIYLRPLAYRGASNILPLSGKDAYSIAIFAFPKPSYHAKSDKFSVLFVPEYRTLSAPHVKRSDNYPQSDLWVERKNRFVKWLGEKRPEIIIDGEKVPAGEKYEAALAMLTGSMNEVLFENPGRIITEGSAENVAIVDGNCFFTPPIEEGALPGFTMQKTELIADKIGLKSRRQRFALLDAKRADLLILTGTAANAIKVDNIVECGWETDDMRNYFPKGPVVVTTIGSERGRELYRKINEEHLLIKAGDSKLGKFGFYADDCLAPREIRELREMAEFIRRNGKMDRTLFRGLAGEVPPGSETKLAGGKQLTYGKLLIR